MSTPMAPGQRRPQLAAAVRRSHVTVLLLLLLAALAALAPRAADAEVIMVFAVSRHGARNVLPKSSKLKEDESTGGPSLLQKGQEMCKAAGTAFSERYISHPSCNSTCLSQPGAEAYGLLNDPGVGFTNYNTLARSSGLDRTLLSAYSFLSGAFPGPDGGGGAKVPVYSTPDASDWRIRGYTKCPSYQARLDKFFASDAFKAKDLETQATRAAIGDVVPGLDVSLTNWWNVYDAFNVWRKYGVGNPMPNITDSQFKQVSAIADWLETNKMASNLTGRGLGGGLLWDVIQRMAAASGRAQSGDMNHYYRLLLVSAHYNTQLGILSAMRLDTDGLTPSQLPWLTSIPATASVLAFELHHGDAGGADSGGSGRPLSAVRLVMQDGPNAAYRTIPLPRCSSAGAGGSVSAAAAAAERLAGPGACELGAFVASYGGGGLADAAEWCDECAAEDSVDACAAARLRLQKDGTGRSGGGGGVSSGAAWRIAVAAVTACVGTAAGAAAAVAVHNRRGKRRWASEHAAAAAGADTLAPPGGDGSRGGAAAGGKAGAGPGAPQGLGAWNI